MKTLLPLSPAALRRPRPYATGKLLRFWLLVLLGVLLNIVSWAQTFPTGFSQVQVANGISNPTVVAFAPDGRIFVGQQAGALRVIKNGSLLSTPFVSLSVNSSGERGLIGIALDPNFSANGYVYLYYTLADGSRNRISRFTAAGDVAAAGSEVVLLDLDPLSSATNHNGGAMNFGPDGKLYVAIGENANTSHAQNLDTYHGKMLRLNPNGSAPADNPYTTGTEQKKRVWSYGLRNPYTFAIQPATGRIFVNDVGQSTWEEINDATSGGLNFGWPATEGPTTAANVAAPVFSYQHGSGDGRGCAITGGTFFNPASTNYPSQYTGKYFYQDLCNQWINYIDVSGSTAVRSAFATGLPGNAVGLTTGVDGNLYYLSRSAGALYRVVYTAPATAPSISTQPASRSVAPGQSASFTVQATGTAPLSYQWQKDGVNISGATGATYTIASVTAADAGQYRVVVSNAAGSVTSAAATLTVTAPNTAPVAQILTPAEGTTYVAGTTFSFSGEATDAEDGTLPASAFSWRVDLHHNVHVHDGTPFNQGSKTGTFTIPNVGHTETDVFYRLYLTVTDAGGLTHTVYRDLQPRLTTLTFATSPAGLQLTLEGQPLTTPATVPSVEGVLRTLGVVSPQTVNGVTYEFVSWSQGGSATQTIATPTDDATYTATFRAVAAQAVTSFTLINADTDQPISGFDPIPAGAVFNLATLPTRNLSIRANTNPATVGSVRFAYDGNANFRTESFVPYAIAGDNGATDYLPWTPTVGSHTLTATPYSAANAGGTAGQALTLNFTATDASLRVPEGIVGSNPGLQYYLYEGTWDALPNFATISPVVSGGVPTFSLAPRRRDNEFAFRYTGYVQVPQDGVYTFYTNSDDGSRLYIGTELVVNNDGLHAAQERSGTIGLQAGVHAITVDFFEKFGGQVLDVSYAGPGLSKQVIPASALFLQVSGAASLRPADNPANTVAGLRYDYYEGTWDALPNFAALTPVKSGSNAALDLSPRDRNDQFAFRYTGFVEIPEDGTYSFYLNSDDGSQLYIGDQLLVNNDGLHSAQERSANIGLKAGLHAITVTYFEKFGQEVFQVSYSGALLSKRQLDFNMLRQSNPGNLPFIALNSGGRPEGRFLADNFFTNQGPTGVASGTTAAIDVSGVTNPAPPAVYQTQREATGNIPVVYRITSGLVAGQTYTVRLHFAEIDYTSVGQRRFNVLLFSGGTSTTLLSNFDIVAAAGGPNKAVVREFTFTAQPLTSSTGYLFLRFDYGAAGEPTVSGIEVVPAGTANVAAQQPTKSKNRAAKLNVRLYPNPARDEATISLEASSAHDTHVEVRDALGRRVVNFTQPTPAGHQELRLPLTGLANGVYMLTVEHGTERSVQRLTVEK
ncbi:PQQ-dependent sugar dehydrogenase [Hymenobacter weizhouensis]|uniref:PQQ-dependent sugar dehydrogenase n=1 Tax=Hymenobacter sp. YIM 151500-1 TaxID=2987689 RepID=UPI0022270BDC|nr:PQQ-dependent sugar dehydrogenase [Hymenobacter sp. YIM 151500-1]UYZ62525.1 PQQ-dependent sugar dehydrogenase [Hymenobacter sp. YIM 151500-1]